MGFFYSVNEVNSHPESSKKRSNPYVVAISPSLFQRQATFLYKKKVRIKCMDCVK